jgi:ankyrin repeat protein
MTLRAGSGTLKLWLVLGVLGLAVYGSWRGARWYESNYEDPLTPAIEGRYYEKARRLVEMGADVNEYGNVPLGLTVIQGNLEFAQYLLDNGADINAVESSPFPELSILELSAEMGHSDHVDWLLQHGAEYTVVTAVLLNDLETVQQRLEKNPELLKREGYPLLHFAARKGHLELATFLLEAGADPDKPLSSPFRGRPYPARKFAEWWERQAILDLFDEWNAAKTAEETSGENIVPDSTALEVPLPEDRDRRSTRD